MTDSTITVSKFIKKKNNILIIITLACSLLGIIGLVLGSPFVTGLMVRNDSIDYYTIEDSISCDGETNTIPSEIDINNFVAYITHEGSSSVEKSYMIINNEGNLNVYARSFNSGDTRVYSGGRVNLSPFFIGMSSLSLNPIPSDAVDGESVSYGYLYYKDGEKTYKCRTNNAMKGCRLFI